jgi:preprotein translocase subunit YajC
MFNVISVFAAEAKQNSFNLGTLIIYALLFIAMFFVLIRPQRKRAKEQRELQGALAEGDHVLLNSGIYGYISQIEEGKPYIWFEANTGVEFRINRSAVAGKTPDPANPSAEQK